MARVDVDQVEVLEALLDRLRQQLSLAESHCFLTLDPQFRLGFVPPGGEWFVTVSPGDGTFPDDMQVGGGANQTTEETEVLVTVYTRVRLDQAGHDVELMHHATRGLLPRKRQVLKALASHDLALPNDDVFLRQLLTVRRCDRPEWSAEKQIGWLTLHVALSWDWDLS